MKILILTSALLYLASLSHAATMDSDFDATLDSDNEMSNNLAVLSDVAARFISATDNGLQLTFNSTSLQYLALFGIPLLLVALVALPLFGISLGSIFPWKKAPIDPYGDYDYSSYTSYTARSLERITPILSIIEEAYQKYQDLQ